MGEGAVFPAAQGRVEGDTAGGVQGGLQECNFIGFSGDHHRVGGDEEDPRVVAGPPGPSSVGWEEGGHPDIRW